MNCPGLSCCAISRKDSVIVRRIATPAETTRLMAEIDKTIDAQPDCAPTGVRF